MTRIADDLVKITDNYNPGRSHYGYGAGKAIYSSVVSYIL